MRVPYHLGEAAIALGIGSLQPFEGTIRFTPVSVDLGNLVGGYVLKAGSIAGRLEQPRIGGSCHAPSR
jgi:hypothetical protein